MMGHELSRSIRRGVRGSMVALATPFSDGKIDQACVTRLCDRQIARGTSAIVVCGSTGEAAALHPEEQRLMVRLAVEAAGERVPVIAGCGASATAFAMDLAASAARNGAAALLCAPPPYVRPTQEGVVGHFKALAAAGLPMLLYDVPARTAMSVQDETVARLYDLGLIFGIKDATADLSRPPRLKARCGGDFVQLSGDDATAAAYRAAGGLGCISVTANVMPALCRQLHTAWDNRDIDEFCRVRDLLAPLTDMLFLESNPIPLKAALQALGLARAEMRLPLTAASAETRHRLTDVLANLACVEEALTCRSSVPSL